MTNAVKITLFGNLTLQYQSPSGEVKILEEEDFHSPSLVVLFSYLAKNHPQLVSSQSIIDLLWQEEEVENPLGTLKNLIYRLRNVLKKLDPDVQFIFTGKKAYGLNPDLILELDTEQLADACTQLQTASTPKEKKACCEKALTYCTGHFLERHADTYWVISHSTSYDSMVKSMISEYCELLSDEGEFEQMNKIAAVALLYDSLDEDFHSYQIRALIGEGKLQAALERYREAEELLFSSLDVEVTETLHSLWPLLMEQPQSKETDIKKVQQNLLDDLEQGAFFCEYGTFKKIYQLEMRRANRMGFSIYMGLITVGFIPMERLSPEKKNKKLQKAMDNLKTTLLSSLRSGDVITRYSKNQYIILLPTCQYETAKMVLSRIERSYYQHFSNEHMALEYSFDSI